MRFLVVQWLALVYKLPIKIIMRSILGLPIISLFLALQHQALVKSEVIVWQADTLCTPNGIPIQNTHCCTQQILGKPKAQQIPGPCPKGKTGPKHPGHKKKPPRTVV
ncbi:hypothetical protein PGT21_015091 [Puccinia graminis f. sp. tritici]|uniref:Uncharacterized protein n=1 Tax=Puccinia graminis f. sp. tritici TaxID=56615 RepID=A0A5B0PEN5_PUCGR|nr:hypothetical protein PGTUg99_016474 [Puccinia graminis f. sp. tritici]KAA1105672.1 hypothetical protein PGT21_015091 [Puccinia graminis f. sp. tritici]